MNRLFITPTFCFFFIASLFGQPMSSDIDPSLSFLPPTPSAAALTKYIDFPVNYHSGAPSIDIPLYTLTGKELAVPVSVSYHAGGVKVDDVASRVGLGWSLNAGGVINRTVVGAADERSDGFIDRGAQVPYPLDPFNNMYELERFAEGTWDGQPDIFSFSFGGYSGKFVIAGPNEIYTIPHQDLDIEYTKCASSCNYPFSGSLISFKVTTPDGMEYTFGTEDAVEYSTTRAYNPYGGNANCNVRNYEIPAMTAWYLKDIYNPKTDDHIVFNYQGYQITYDLSYTENYKYPNRYRHSACPGTTEINKCVTEKTDMAKVLTSIQSNNGRIEFINGSRSDLSGVRLSEVHIKGKNGGLLKKFKLQQTFITSSGSTPSTSSFSNKRMYLDEIEEYSSTNLFINEYQFNYFNRSLLPPRMSFKQDHWGYYNGKPNNQLTPTPDPTLGTLNDIQFFFPNFDPADRTVDTLLAKYGVLNEVIYPTGGSVKYDFESNDIPFCGTTEEIQPAIIEAFADYQYSNSPTYDSIDFTIDHGQLVNIDYDVVMIGFRCQGAVVKIKDLSNYNQVIFDKGGCGQFYNPVTLTGTHSMWLPAGNYRIVAAALRGPDPFFQPPYNQISERARIKVHYRETITSYVENKTVGGIRVHKITYNDGDVDTSNNIVKVIDYDEDFGSGCNQSTGIYLGGPQNYQTNEYQAVPGGLYCSMQLCGFKRLTSTSKNHLASNGGLVVGYTNVKERFGLNSEDGYKQYEYNIFLDGQPEMGPNEYGTFISTPRIDNSFRSGKLIRESSYDSNNHILHEKLFDYEFAETVNENRVKAINAKRVFEKPCQEFTTMVCDGPNDNQDAFMVISRRWIRCDPLPCRRASWRDTVYFPCYGVPTGDTILNAGVYDEYAIEFYEVISQWVYLKETIERQYTPGTSDYVETTTTMSYDKPSGRHTNVTSALVINSDGKELRTDHLYVPEMIDQYGSSAVFQDMLDRNMLGIPLETIQKTDNDISGGSKIDFSFYDGSGLPTTTNTGRPPMPYQFYRYEVTWDENGAKVDNGWNLRATVDEYTTDGLVEKVTVAGWSPEMYTWNDGLLTQKSFLNYTWQYNYDPNSRLLTQMTDVDGQVTDYTYDDAMRLETASARGGNVETTYTYHYKNGSTDHNWVETKTDYTAVTGSDLTEQRTRQYLDGLGRPTQTVQIKHSPDQKDVVTQTVYDAQGRVIREYVPYESDYNDGRYVHVPSSVEYTETVYENGPLNRVEQVTPPAWYATTTDYAVNINGEVVDPLTNTPYPANSLSKVVVTDPNGNKTITFTDKQGRQILLRKTDASVNTTNDTYYDYDDRNRLRTVIPPGANSSDSDLIFEYVYDGFDNIISKKIPGQATIETLYNIRNQPTYTQDGNLASQGKWMMTKYDNYGRVTETGFYNGTPASGDEINNFSERLTKNIYGTSGITEGKVTYTEAKILGSSSTFLKTWMQYDSYGRMDYSRGNNHRYPSYSYAEYNTFRFDYADNVLNTYRRHHGNTSQGFIYIRDNTSFDHSGRQKDYKHRLNSGTRYLVSRNEYNYRDFLTRKRLHETSTDNFLQNVDYYYNDQGWLTRINDFCEPEPGLPGGGGPGGGFDFMTLELEVNPEEMQESSENFQYRILMEADVIDKEGHKNRQTVDRVIATSISDSGEVSTRYLSEAEASSVQFKQKIRIDLPESHIDPGEYLDFMLEVEQQVMGQLNVEAGTSNEIGMIIANEVQAAIESTAPVGAPPLALPLGGGGGGGNDEEDLFAMKLFYDTPNTTLNADEQRNGNISHIGWQVGCNNEQWYGFEYDYLNRITNAKYAETSFSSGNYVNSNRYNLTGLNYDPRGNITNLRRRGLMSGSSTFGLMDILNYTYANNGASNQLTRIQEWTGTYATKGFKTIRINGIGDYTYDANGNLISDEHKGITNIEYNHLNLPERITFANGNWIEWTYDANGTKLRKTTSAGDNRDYAGNVEYLNGTREAVYHAEGRCTPDGSSWQYEYTLRDHLGNTRVTFADLDDNNAVDETEILQQNHYYPFGMNMEGSWTANAPNKYQYNGKELNEEFGLEWLDYGARWYDPAVARWLAVDPLAEKYLEWSGYNYVLNNPVLLVDPDGRDTGRVYVLDQQTRPNDNGTKGGTYTADIYVLDDESGELSGPYDGSSYPNSKSNSDNTTSHNTVDEGEYKYNNKDGHKGGTKKGLNIVDDNGDRNVPGTDPDGNSVTMTYVNVHSGVSDKGNYNSRGSEGCITICPKDVSNFFSNFDFSGSNGKKGKASGTIIIKRGNKKDEIERLKNKASTIKVLKELELN